MKKRTATNRVIFHHSLALVSSASEIRRWHLARGFEDIGYHKVIRKDGSIEDGRDIAFVGAHAEGRNHDSIGVCFEGDFRTEEPGEEQICAAILLYHCLCRAYSKNLEIEFHRDEDNPCPGPKLNRADLVYRIEEEGGI